MGIGGFDGRPSVSGPRLLKPTGLIVGGPSETAPASAVGPPLALSADDRSAAPPLLTGGLRRAARGGCCGGADAARRRRGARIGVDDEIRTPRPPQPDVLLAHERGGRPGVATAAPRSPAPFRRPLVRPADLRSNVRSTDFVSPRCRSSANHRGRLARLLVDTGHRPYHRRCRRVVTAQDSAAARTSSRSTA